MVAHGTTLYSMEVSTMACDAPKPFIPAANTARVRAIFDTPGGKAMNVTHWRKATPFDKDDLAALCTEYENAWEAQFSPLQSNVVEMTRIIATDISAEDSYEVDRAPLIDLTGGRTDTIMHDNVTIATKFGTGLSGRSHRGRSYHIGLTNDQCTGDQAAAGTSDAIRDAWIDFAGTINDSDLAAELVVVSYCQDKEWLSDAEVNAVTEFTTENTLDSMRTRLAGRGM